MAEKRSRGLKPLGRIAFAAALAAVLVPGTVGWAQTSGDYDVYDGSTLKRGEHSLANAIYAVNKGVADGSYTSPAIVINRAGTFGWHYFVLNGTDDPGTPTAAKAFTNITIGGKDGVTDPDTGETTGGITGILQALDPELVRAKPLLAIINAKETITVKNMIIRDQTSGAAYNGTMGNFTGGGLMVGGVATDLADTEDNDSYYGAPQTFENFIMTNVTIDNNKVLLDTGAAIGGGLSVFNGDNATLTDFAIKNNEARLISLVESTSSAIGGGARFLDVGSGGDENRLSLGYGSVANNTAHATNASHAHGGGVAIEGDDMSISIGAHFYDNKAKVDGATSDPNSNAVARGGGLYMASDVLGAEACGATVGGSFTSNKAEASDSTGLVANAAIGGGAVVHGNIEATFFSTFASNEATSVDGEAKGGALASLDQLATGAQAGPLTISSATLTGNKAQGGTSAMGGAVYAEGQVAIDSSSISGNKAISSAGGARGGGLYAAVGAVVDKTTFTSNEASTQGAGAGMARGGAIYLDNGDLSLQNSTFGGAGGLGNKVSASTEEARGGAVYYSGNGEDKFTITDTSFIGNQALGQGAETNTRGGAVYRGAGKLAVSGTVEFADNTAHTKGGWAAGGAWYNSSDAKDLVLGAGVSFTGNKVVADDDTGLAHGGALYLNHGDHALTDVNFTGNSATAATAANAKGGAIFMDTGGGLGESNLKLVASNYSTTTISGNTANGKSSGIHVGSSNSMFGSDHDASLTIDTDGAMATMRMLDALSVDMDNDKSFAFAKTGAGQLEMGQTSSVKMDGTGQADFQFKEGSLKLADNFQLKAEAGEVNIEFGKDLEVSFDSLRDDKLAFFRRGADASGEIKVDSAKMEIDNTARHLLDFTATYVFVEGKVTKDDAEALNKFAFSGYLAASEFVWDEGGKINLNLNYTSPYKAAIKAAGANTGWAIQSLDHLVKILSEDEIAIIVKNFDTATPEYGAVAGTMGLNVTQFVSRMAVRQGLRGQHSASLPTPLSAQPSFGGPHEGARVWGGYAGNFRQVENAGGYYGYDQDTSAAMVGLSYDLGPEATIGLFGAYSNNKAKLDRISSEVESDGTHLGLLARLSPGSTIDPNLAIYLDASYNRYENDAYRRYRRPVSEKITSDFDQTAYTAGLGVEYAVPVNYEVLLTPSLDLRYTKLEQDSYREKGLTANYIKGYDVNSFTSSLALTASREISIDGGTITPSARLGWNHEYGDTDVSTTARYINPAGGLMPAYKLGTVDQNRDSMDAGVAMRALLNSGSYHQLGVNVSYDVNISKDADSHSVYGGLEYSF